MLGSSFPLGLDDWYLGLTLSLRLLVLGLLLFLLPLLFNQNSVFFYFLFKFENFDVYGFQLFIELLVLNDLAIDLFGDLLLSSNRVLHGSDELKETLHGIHIERVELKAKTMKRTVKVRIKAFHFIEVLR